MSNKNASTPVQFSEIFVDQAKTIDLGGGNSITVSKMTFGMQQKAISRSSKIDVESGTVQIDFAMLRMNQLYMCVEAWAGPAFDDMPLKKENIDKLSPDVAKFVLDQIQDINMGITVDEKND